MYPLATYGWMRSSGGGAFASVLNKALQWLYTFLSPNELDDKTINALKADVVDSPCGTFDGVGDYVSLGTKLPLTGDFNLSISASCDDPSPDVAQLLFSQYNAGSGRMLIVFRASEIRFVFGGVNRIVASGVVGDVWYDVMLTRTSGVFELFVEGVSQGTYTNTTPIDDITPVLGARSDVFSGNFGGKICCYNLEGVERHPFIESSSPKVYDVSGNGNDGTITTGAGGLAAFWGGTQDVSHYFAENGGSKLVGFNGTDAEGQYTNSNITTTWDVTVTGIFDGTSGGAIWSKATGATTATDIAIDISTGLLRGFFYSSGVAKITTATETIADGSPHTVRYVNTGTTQQLYVDGSPVGSSTSHTATPDNDTSVCNIASRNGTSFAAHKIVSVDDSTYQFYSRNAYGTTLPDSSGNGNDATLINTEFLYIPALADGSDDAEGLGITNPGNIVHNNGPHKIQQKAANTEFLDNLFWSADGIAYDKKSFADLVAHGSFDNNVIVKWRDDCFVSDIVTWAQSYAWTPSTYHLMLAWLGSACYTPVLIPIQPVVGGIGPDGDWFTYDGIHILLVEDA